MKQCKICSNYFDENLFYNLGKYLSSYCKECDKKKARERKSLNRVFKPRKKFDKENRLKNDRNKEKKQRQQLSDRYIKSLINDSKRILLPSNYEEQKDFIELYRQRLILKRALSKWKNTENT